MRDIRKLKFKDAAFSLGMVVLSLGATALLLVNVADREIIPNFLTSTILDNAVEEGFTEISNIVFASIAVLAVVSAVMFGSRVKRMRADESSLEIADNEVAEGLIFSTPVVSIGAWAVKLVSKAVKSEPVYGRDEKLMQHSLLCNLGGVVIAGGVLSIIFAEQIHDFFLNNNELPAELSKAMANILAPEHILGMAIGVIAIVSIPLLHSMFTDHKLDITLATPIESMLGEKIANSGKGYRPI